MARIATNNQFIYVVDDDTAIARLGSVNLAAQRYRVKEFDRGSSAIAQLGLDDPEITFYQPVTETNKVCRVNKQSTPHLAADLYDHEDRHLVSPAPT